MKHWTDANEELWQAEKAAREFVDSRTLEQKRWDHKTLKARELVCQLAVMTRPRRDGVVWSGEALQVVSDLTADLEALLRDLRVIGFREKAGAEAELADQR